MPIEKIHVKISVIGLIVLILAFIVPNINGPTLSWLWGVYLYNSSISLNRSLFHLLCRIIISLIILPKIVKIFKEIKKAKNNKEDPKTFKKILTKKSIIIIILTIILMVTNRIRLPYDINVNLLIQGGNPITINPYSTNFNVNFSIPGFNILALFIGSIIIIIGAQLYNKEFTKDKGRPTQEYERQREEEALPSPTKVESGEKGLSTKYPEVVVTKKDMFYLLISGLILSVFGTVTAIISSSLEPFFSNFDAFAQALGTGIGLAICGYAFLFMYFFIPDATKRLLARIKGVRAEQKALRIAKKEAKHQ